MALKVGDTIPDATVSETDLYTTLKLRELFAGKKGILFGIPGAFTPGCHKTHLPGYVQRAEELKGKGIDVIACMGVNDPFVMAGWGETVGATGKVRMLADKDASASKALGVYWEGSEAIFGSGRCKRFSMLIEDNIIKVINVEPDNGGLSCSLVEPLLATL